MAKTPKRFSVTAIINGNTFSKKTDNVEATLLELQPEQVFSEMYVTVQHKEGVSERRLTALNAKKFYQDEVFRQVFMNNLLLT
jgi:hypothetical protein